jgi:hypothetical protein
MNSSTSISKRKWKQFCIIVIFNFFTIISAIAAMNIIINPYGIFEKHIFNYGDTTNERYLKTKHVEKVNRYDAWIMGTSRPGILDPRLIENKKNERIYNYSFFSAKPSEILTIIDFFSKTKEKIPERIYLGIEYFPFQDGYTGLGGYARSFPPDVSGKSEFNYMFMGVFAKSIGDSFSQVMNHYKTHNINFDIENGFYTLIKYNTLIKNNHEQYIKKTFSTESKEIDSLKWSLKEFKALRKIKELSEELNIELIIFKNPIHPKQKNLFSETKRQEWEDNIKALEFKSYIDFSKRDEIVNNNENWYDTRHYLPKIAVKLFNEMIKKNI